MATGIRQYYPLWIENFVRNQPLWRRILAIFFEKYRFKESEFIDWMLK